MFSLTVEIVLYGTSYLQHHCTHLLICDLIKLSIFSCEFLQSIREIVIGFGLGRIYTRRQ